MNNRISNFCKEESKPLEIPTEIIFCFSRDGYLFNANPFSSEILSVHSSNGFSCKFSAGKLQNSDAAGSTTGIGVQLGMGYVADLKF